MADLTCKVCGLTRPQDVALCHDLWVDITGFIFAKSSPRAVTPELVAAMPRGPALRAGVFAGVEATEVLRVARQAKLDLIQLHGGEDEAFCRTVGPERVIKVLWPERLEPNELERELARFAPVCAYFLLDAGGSGGSGRTLDLQGLTQLTPVRPWFLAGGLGPRNLGRTLASWPAFAHPPSGVDLNSALEIAPGIKDHDRVREAIALLHTHGGPGPLSMENQP